MGALRTGIGYAQLMDGNSIDQFDAPDFWDNIKKLREYFGEHDKTPFEHWAFNFFTSLMKHQTKWLEENDVAQMRMRESGD